MQKVGIFTFSYSCNAGSVLQAYALQNTVSSLEGYEATIVNYSKTQYGKPVIGKNVFTKSLKDWTPKNILTWIAQILTYSLRMKKYTQFFQEYYRDFNGRLYQRHELPQLNGCYDKFIVGSDQVWNYGSPQVDETYFFDFVTDNSKKIAYAASFGQKSVPEAKRDTARSLISQFSAISVREPDGVGIVKELVNRDATLVLDPSLMLNKQDYAKLSIAPKQQGYVFLYLRQESKPLEAFAKKLAKAKGLKLVKVLYHWQIGKTGLPKAAVGPRQWLGFIQNADYVVTNSFHGMCFSINFEREFYLNYLKASATSTNSRMEGLLKQFDLSGRHMDDVTDFQAMDTIDYNRVNNFKARRQEESLSYLKAALEGNS